MRAPPANLAGSGSGPSGPANAAKRRSHLRDDHPVIDRAGRRDHHVGRAVIAREIRAQPARIERAHRLGRAEDRAADRLVRERDALEIFEDQVVGRVLGGADFLHDDVLLARELLRLEGRIGEDVGQHVERERHVGAQHARVIGRALDAGRRIEIAADRLDLLGDLPRGAPRVPLNAMCSRKCEMPFSSGCSSRLPAPTHTPSEALCRCGIASVTTVSPEGSRVTSMLMRQLLRARHGSPPE